MEFFLVWTLLIVAAVWFLLLRPQRRRYLEHQDLMSGLEVGHEVITAGGIHGRVEALDDDVIHLEVAPGAVIRVARRAVMTDLTRQRQTGTQLADGDDGDDPGSFDGDN